MTFYDPSNAVAMAGREVGAGGSAQLKIEIVERHVASVEELRRGLKALKAQDADAYFYTNDAMVVSQAQFIIDTARPRSYRRCSEK